MQVFAETERLILRELLPEDDADMWEMDSDPEVHIYLGNKPLINIEEIRTGIGSIRQQYIDNGIGRWAMIEKDSNNFIGWTGLKLVREDGSGFANYYDLGYRLNKKYWGKGYATESAIASVDYGFNTMKLKEILGRTETGNIASLKVLEKAGLKFIKLHDWDDVAHNWLGITKEEWLKHP